VVIVVGAFAFMAWIALLFALGGMEENGGGLPALVVFMIGVVVFAKVLGGGK
jgi:hypothetical protein